MVMIRRVAPRNTGAIETLSQIACVWSWRKCVCDPEIGIGFFKSVPPPPPPPHCWEENEISAFFCKNATSFVIRLFKLVFGSKLFDVSNIWQNNNISYLTIIQELWIQISLFFAAIVACLSFIAMHQLLILPITRKLENKRRAYYQALDDRMQTFTTFFIWTKKEYTYENFYQVLTPKPNSSYFQSLSKLTESLNEKGGNEAEGGKPDPRKSFEGWRATEQTAAFLRWANQLNVDIKRELSNFKSKQIFTTALQGSCNGEIRLGIFHFQDYLKGKWHIHFLIHWVLL